MNTEKMEVPTRTGVVFETVGDVPKLKGRRIAIMGDSGCGKTFLAATFPKPAFIDADDNIGTLKQDSFKKYAPHVDESKIKRARIKENIDPKTGLFIKAVAYRQVLEAANVYSEDPEVETIVFDTLTSISFFAMNVGIELTQEDGRSETLKEARRGDNNFPLYTMADYGAEMGVIEQLMMQLPYIEKTVIMNLHIRTEKNAKGATLHYNPLITGDKHRQKFGSWFNEVWWLETYGNGRRLVTKQDSVKKGLKTTMDLPAEIIDPTYAKIMSYVK